MTSAPRAPDRVLMALCVVTVTLLGSGCHRAVKPEAGGDRTVEAGVSVGFGSEAPDAPAVTWDFGDGSPREQGARVSHAFARQGEYTVRALEKDVPLASARLTVVPRPVLRAIPGDAEAAVFFPQLRGNVDAMMEFTSRLVGEAALLQSLDAMPLLGLVLRDARGEGQVVDPDEGMGFFSLPGFEGNVVLLGVTDPRAAQDAVVEELRTRGATVAQHDSDGTVLLRRDSGVDMLLFLDRGYLYLVVPDAPEAPPTPDGAIQKTLAQAPGSGSERSALNVVRARITGAMVEDLSLSESPLLGQLRPKVAPGHLHVYGHPSASSGSDSFQGAWAVVRFQEDLAALEGWMMSDATLGDRAASAPASRLLEKAPLGPIAALSLSVAPETLNKLVFGAPGSEQREAMTRRLSAQGLDAASVEGLLNALRGDLALLAYVDAAAFYRNLFQGSQKPEPRGSVLFQAGLTRAEPVVEWLTGMLQARKQPFQSVREAGTTRLSTRILEQPVEFAIQSDRVTMRGGEPLEARPQGSVGTALHERFGAGGFESGHLSAMMDVGRAISEMRAPGQVPGVTPQQLSLSRTLVDSMIERLPPVDSVFLDLAPEPQGARFQMSLRLRSR